MRSRLVPVLSAATAVSAAIGVPAASAAPAALEQFNRATGVAGLFGLDDGYPNETVGGVTDNGRYVFFGVKRPLFDESGTWIKDAVPGEGLWVRDVLLNKTTKISSDGEGFFSGIDRTQHVISFITSEGLAGSADTNGKPDLYAYEPLTGLKVLLSRANGFGGKAVGLTSQATVTRGSTTAIFGAADGIYKRDLLLGRTTKIGTGAFIAPLTPFGLPFPISSTTADQYVSNDAKVFTTDTGVVTPTGVKPLPLDELGRAVSPWINEAGTRSISQASIQALDRVSIQNLTTGAITQPTVPAEFTEQTGVIHRPTPDGSGVILGWSTSDYESRVSKWTFATGAVSDLGGLVINSRNEKYGVTGDKSGALLVGGVGTNKLPGGVDLPAATAYLDYNDGCTFGDEGSTRLLQVAPELNRKLPAATSVRFKASAGAGQPVVVDETRTFPVDDEWHEELQVELPFADGAFRLDVTVTLADGRTVTSRVDHGPRPIADGC